MTNAPKTRKNRAAKVLRATAGSRRGAKRGPTTEQVKQIIRDLKKVAKDGARSKLPDATSDHDFLYGAGGAPA